MKQLPTLLLSSKNKPFWREKDFWRDRNPISIDQLAEERLNMHPSKGQYEVLYALAGKDPYEWDTSYQQYVIAVGMRGGKNAYITSIYLTYITYMISNMKSPYDYFDRFYRTKLNRTQKFDIVNTSVVGEKQAENVHFENITALIKKLKAEDGTSYFEKYLGMDMRSGFGDINSKEISVPTNIGEGGICHHSFNSSPRSWEGLALIVSVNDEVSRAESKPDYNKVKKSWDGQVANVGGTYGQRVGKVIAISYLNSSDYDFTDDLLKQAEEQRDRAKRDSNFKPLMYSITRSTFDMNPNKSIEDDEVREAYRNDPNTARARYECIKGSSKFGFYQPHPEKIRQCFYDDIESPVDYNYKVVERSIKHPSSGIEQIQKFVAVSLNSIKGDSRIRGLVFDAAKSFDAFILKGGYIETMEALKTNLFTNGESGEPETVIINQKPIIDICITWQPQNNLSVDYLNFGEIIGALLNAFPNTRFVNSDPYQSEQFSQMVRNRGVSSETFAFSNPFQLKIFRRLRLLIHRNIPQIMKDKHLILKRGITKTAGEWNIMEHEQLMLVNGIKIDHPSSGGKDYADCDALLTDGLTQLEIKDFGVSSGGVSDGKLRALGEKYLITRAKLKIKGIKEKDKLYIKKVAEMMNVTEDQAKTIKEFAETQYSGLL